MTLSSCIMGIVESSVFELDPYKRLKSGYLSLFDVNRSLF